MPLAHMTDHQIMAMFKGDSRRSPLHGRSVYRSKKWLAAQEASELNRMIADIWRRRGRVWQ